MSRKPPKARRALVSSLSLNGLRVPIHLGWGAEERKRKQFVSFQVKVAFRSIPEASRNDDLEFTVCYDRISEALKKLCAAKSYRLIEHLGYEAFEAVKAMTPSKSLLWIEVKKEKPPIEGLVDGASFSVADTDFRA